MALTYWMSGLPAEYFRFALFAAIGLIVSFVAEGMGLAIGATFSITVRIRGIYQNNLIFVIDVETVCEMHLDLN